MANVYTYWRCDSCNTIIRGDLRECPNCGAPIPNGVKYLMPDNPTVIAAMKSGKICTVGRTHTDEKGIVAEVVEHNDERHSPNWECSYCGCQNFAEDTSCRGCGSSRTESKRDYFGNTLSENEDDFEDSFTIDECTDKRFYETKDTYTSDIDNSTIDTEETEETEVKVEHIKQNEDIKENKFSLNTFKNFIYKLDANVLKYIFISLGVIGLVIFLVWLFTPITRSAKIQSFGWQRSIEVEQYKECHESDWSLPNNAILEETQQEIHHYDKVIDHYETKSRQVSEQVFDGYDTSYRDLGNGQAETVQTPRYRTEYHTEYYEEPVYKDVPVYQTKYYYEIGRWKYSYSLNTSGNDQNPYWHETDLPTNVNNPQYDDLRQSTRSEKYIIKVIDYNKNIQNVEYNYSEWIKLKQYDTIDYKTFRFSDKPL